MLEFLISVQVYWTTQADIPPLPPNPLKNPVSWPTGEFEAGMIPSEPNMQLFVWKNPSQLAEGNDPPDSPSEVYIPPSEAPSTPSKVLLMIIPRVFSDGLVRSRPLYTCQYPLKNVRWFAIYYFCPLQFFTTTWFLFLKEVFFLYIFQKSSPIGLLWSAKRLDATSFGQAIPPRIPMY